MAGIPVPLQQKLIQALEQVTNQKGQKICQKAEALCDYTASEQLFPACACRLPGPNRLLEKALCCPVGVNVLGPPPPLENV